MTISMVTMAYTCTQLEMHTEIQTTETAVMVNLETPCCIW